MAQEHVEEYLEAIYDLAGEKAYAKTGEIAERLKVSPASVTEAIQRLRKKGYIQYHRYKGVSLTSEGLALVHRIKRKHRLLEVFLHDILKIDKDKVHDQACKMEHTISDETEDALNDFLNSPKVCPHGSPIPSRKMNEPEKKGDTRKEKSSQGGVPLISLRPGQRAKVISIHGGCGLIRRLSEMGLLPGTALTVVRASPMHGPVEVFVHGSNVMLGQGIARRILVAIEKNSEK